MRLLRVAIGTAFVGVLMTACAQPAPPAATPSPQPTAPAATPSPSSVNEVVVAVRALAGPVCPVVTAGASGCDDRPVADAELIVRTLPGGEVKRVRTDPNGRAEIRVPPGSYVLEPQPVQGLMGTAPPVEFTVVAGQLVAELVAAYDTGIR